MVAPRTLEGTAPSRSWWPDLGILGLVTVALRLPALAASTHLTFDDGVYGASAVAMRAGGQPYRDVFSSQGPLFLPLLWLGDLVGLRTANAPRTLSLAAALLLVGATYAAGRSITDRAGAALAAGVVTATATSLWVTGPIAADGVALALATLTVAMVLRWRGEVTLPRAVLIGLGVGATVSVKAMLAPVVLPAALVLLAGRRLAPILAGAGTAVAFHLLLWLPWGVAEVWAQSYDYHLQVASDRTPGANLRKVLSTMGDRDSIVLAVVVLALGAVLLRRRAAVDRSAPSSGLGAPDTLLLAWVGGVAVVLLSVHPMWRPHVSQLLPGLALLAARHRPPWRVLALAGVVVVPYHLVRAWDILAPEPYDQRAASAVEVLRTLPEGALAISDEPGLVWRAGRLTPPDLVDASRLRIEVGDITSARLARVAAADEVCAVVVTSRERWGGFDDLPARLREAGYEVAVADGDVHRTYLKRACAPR